jgi:hypothetical protein
MMRRFQRDKMQRGSLDEPSQKRPRAPTTGSRDPFIPIYSNYLALIPAASTSLLWEGRLPHQARQPEGIFSLG